MYGGVVRALMRRPGLWGEALRAAFAFAPTSWWRHAPFLPVPPREYLRWRIATAYGDPDAAVVPEDLIRFLDWRRVQRRQAS